MSELKTCMNCAYRKGSFEYGRCLLTGKYPDMTRQYGDARCDAGFSGWKKAKRWWEFWK